MQVVLRSIRKCVDDPFESGELPRRLPPLIAKEQRSGTGSTPAGRALRKSLLREKFISELEEHLLSHQGPDSEGRAHPGVKLIKADILECAIERAKSRGLIEGWRPYHFLGHLGTYDDLTVVNEVLKKKCDQLLQEKFGGDLFRLLTEATLEDLLSDLTDTVAGRKISVSMGAVGNKFSSSTFEMLARYREIEGLAQFSELRPYHMSRASSGTYDDLTVVNEVLKKKCDQLLKEKFGGDLFRLLTEATQEDLLSDLTDTVAGRKISVSMGPVGHKFSCSPFAMLARYLEIEGVTQFSELRPYHMSRASSGTYDDLTVVNEVLKKKCDQLLKEKFGGDLFRLLTEATQEDLLSDLTDTVAGRKISVSMAAVGNKFSCSPFEMFKRYHKLIGRPISFTPHCLVGPPEARARRLRGEFNALDRRLMRTHAGDFDTSRFGLRVFNAPEKQAVRERIIESAAEALVETPVKYLGLEDQELKSIRLVRGNLNFSPEQSVVIERERRVFNAMNTLRASLPNGEGRALRKVTIIHGSIEGEIQRLQQSFNLVNLDFVGHLLQANVATLRALFSGRLDDRAVIAVTLMNEPIARKRSELAGLGSGGAQELPRLVQEVSKEEAKYDVQTIGEISYVGGTRGRNTEMITFLFLSHRKARELKE